MEQLVAALISSAIVIVGAIGTFVTTNLTKKSVKSNNDELVKKLDEIDKKLTKLESNYTQIEHKLNKSEIRNEKRLLRIEQDIFLLKQNKDKKVEVEQNEQRL